MSVSKVSIIIPVFNEQETIGEVIRRIQEADIHDRVEVVVVDDCSTDSTIEVINRSLDKLAKDGFKVVVERLSRNSGKGAAIHRGLSICTGDIVTVNDADFEYDPRDLKRLIYPIFENEADIVYGSRFRKDSPQVHRTLHYFINRLLTFLSNILSGLYLSDMESCYKVFRSDIVKNISLKSPRFGFEPEITAKIARLKVRVHEYPISYFPRTYLEGKKISWKDGLAALWHLISFNVFFKQEDIAKVPQRFKAKERQWL